MLAQKTETVMAFRLFEATFSDKVERNKCNAIWELKKSTWAIIEPATFCRNVYSDYGGWN